MPAPLARYFTKKKVMNIIIAGVYHHLKNNLGTHNDDTIKKSKANNIAKWWSLMACPQDMGYLQITPNNHGTP